eukprot:3866326-Rhodomonas_salina.4
MPGTPDRSAGLSSTPRGNRSTSLLEQVGPVSPTRPRTAHPTSRSRPPYRPPHNADSWQGKLKKPQYISTIREQVTVSDRLWKSYSKIMSLQPLESTLAAIQSGQRMHASPEPAEGRDQVRLFPEGSGSKWSLFTRRQTRSAHTASDPPTAEAVQGPELLLEQPASPKDFTNVEEQDPSPCRVPLDSIPETPKTRRETHHIPSPRNLAGSPGRPGILMQQRRNSTSLLDRTLKSPSILPERIDAEKARSIIEEKAAKLRAAKRPEKRVIQYDLPNQQMLVVADQSAHATRESVYLVGKYAREKAEKEKVRRRLLELYWRKGAIPAAKKDDARRALELDDIESAERIIEETETAMRHAARARAIAEIAALAVGKPLSP